MPNNRGHETLQTIQCSSSSRSFRNTAIHKQKLHQTKLCGWSTKATGLGISRINSTFKDMCICISSSKLQEIKFCVSFSLSGICNLNNTQAIAKLKIMSLSECKVNNIYQSLFSCCTCTCVILPGEVHQSEHPHWAMGSWPFRVPGGCLGPLCTGQIPN